MIMIISEQGYPKKSEVLARVDYFIKVSPSEGGILIVGQDSRGKEYRPKNEPAVKGSYVLPSGKHYTVPVGSNREKNYPAIHFPFELNVRLRYPEILKQAFDDEFFSKFDLNLMDESMQRIFLLDAEVEGIFKEIAVWGAYELAGLLKNHFWGEIYRERTPVLERFLERFRR